MDTPDGDTDNFAPLTSLDWQAHVYGNGSKMSLSAPCTTRSRMAGIPKTRTFFPSAFGISTLRFRSGR